MEIRKSTAQDLEQIMADYTLENIMEKIDSRGDAA